MADTLTFRLDPELRALITAEAERRHLNLSDTVRAILGTALTAPENPPSAARKPEPRRAVPAHAPPRIPAAGRTVQTYSKGEQVSRRDR